MIINFQDLVEKVGDKIMTGKSKEAVDNYVKEKKQDFNDTSKVSVKTLLSLYLNAFVELNIFNGDTSFVTGTEGETLAKKIYNFVEDYPTYD